MSFRSLLLVSLFGFFLSNVALAATPAEQLRSADKLINEVDAIWTGGDHTTIEAKLRRALEIRQELLGSDHALVGDVLGRMGRNEWNRHDYAAAEPLFRRAVAIGERAEPSSFNTARLLGDLGATLRVRGKYAEAEALVRRSVEMRRHLRPPNQPFVASGLDNLGRVLTAEHRYAEAEEAVAESLNIRRAALGPDHEMTRGSEAFLNGLRTVRNPWRIAQREGLILAVCLLGLVVLVSQRLYAGRRAALAINTNLTNPAPPVLSGGEVALELLLYSVRFGCGAGAGYATYLAAVTLLPLYLFWTIEISVSWPGFRPSWDLSRS